MKRLLEEMEGYETEVKVFVTYTGEDDIDYTTTVPLQYDIELEYRSWGIKEVLFSFKPISIEVWLLDVEGDQGEKKVIDLDMTAAKKSWSAGESYMPLNVDVTLNPDFSVKSIEIGCSYIKPQDG